MRKNVKWLSILLTTLIIFSFLPVIAEAAGPLDEIQDYRITVHMRPDGTMDIRYRIEWTVLDDTSEGPLSWVKIGNPNWHVDEITAISDNIKDISYMNENGSYIRIDFEREYHAGETIIFEYTIHQSYMYIIEEDTHICRYSFTPGWFEEIQVKNITIMWSDENVIESTAHKHEDGYLIWTSSLGMGERLNASVKYNLDAFTTNPDEQYTEDAGDDSGLAWIILIVVIVVIVVFLILYFAADDYGSGSGFGGGYRSTHIYHSSCVRSSCACVSSCACACACAGGGRAGCSKKDFYGTNLRTNQLEKVLKQKKR